MTVPGTDPAERVRDIFATAVSDGLRADSVTGASDDEIDSWAADQGARAVPVAVREALRLIGRDHGLWLAGSSLGVTAVRRKTKDHLLASLPALGDPLADPAGALVLVEHQSYAFHVVDGTDVGAADPPVWLVVEGGAAERQWESASYWFRTIAPDVARYRERLEVMREIGRTRLPRWARDLSSTPADPVPGSSPRDEEG